MSDQKQDKETPPTTTNSPASFSPIDFEQVVKKPKFTTPTPPWKQQPGPGLQSPTDSPDTPSSSSAHQSDPTKQQQQQLRKGKYVSPVWKPNEMLYLAKAWRAQYLGPGPEPGEAGPGRGKTRAEKDKEVAEYLARHGVNRDAKTAGTKWDNMLGEFRKVYEWERSQERDQVGKSYFRLSPYERKIHRLPASFDELVFEELSQFMGARMRPTSHSSGGGGVISSGSFSSTTSSLLHFHQGLLLRSGGGGGSGSGEFVVKALPPTYPHPHPSISSFREDDFSLSSMFSGRTRQMEEYTTMRNNPRNPILLGFDSHHQHQHPQLDYGATPSTRVEMRRIGRMRMSWEESVSLWGEEGGDFHNININNRGRIKLHGGSSMFNADEIVYFDETMVASTLEFFEDGPLKGFSVDSFVPGQLLKVFGRKKSSSSSSGVIERIANPIAELSTRWEFQDQTDFHLGCLRALLPTTLPSLIELSWYIQEPPPEELRIPLRKDIYRDLPQGRELFFTTSSSEPFIDCKSFTIDILSSLIRPNPCIGSSKLSTGRDSYIGLWDDCINRVVSKFCPIEMVFIRKQHKSKPSPEESMVDQWPNLTGMVKNLCLWRGEEVDRLRESESTLDNPSVSITRKLSWTYNDLPYVLGYYAIGYNVTFCALSPSQKPSSSATSQKSEIIRTDLYSIDLSNPSERLKSIIPCWRIGILLASLAAKCPKFCQSDFCRQELGDGNVITEMTPNTVTKVYPSKIKWQKVKEIYDMLDQRIIPHVEHVICHAEIELSLVFKPRGIKIKPKNCIQLVLALKQVTKSLVALHDLSFMHRDLSWDKVMLRSKDEDNKDENEEEWFVSGFEEAVGAPQINPRATEEGSGRHAPEMARGVHGVKVDVWGVGYLVKTSGVQITKSEENVVGKKLREMEVKCMEQNPELRPTAADCYHHLLQIQTSLLSSASPSCC
ncbi:hypothetical protein RND81_05G079400 [Saponaria officinalis]|uniref:Protein kinase domain-containing protein n=1 Tax=Saponaria officinalis TaxID=3572 RepID=A0AAW1KWL7_SAPOF